MQSLSKISVTFSVLELPIYNAVVLQLQKDFELSGLQWNLSENLQPVDFVTQLYNELFDFAQHDFDDFLQLLYRVDVDEGLLYSEEKITTKQLAQNAIFLILERTLQKIQFRLKYS